MRLIDRTDLSARMAQGAGAAVFLTIVNVAVRSAWGEGAPPVVGGARPARRERRRGRRRRCRVLRHRVASIARQLAEDDCQRGDPTRVLRRRRRAPSPSRRERAAGRVIHVGV